MYLSPGGLPSLNVNRVCRVDFNVPLKGNEITNNQRSERFKKGARIYINCDTLVF